MWELIVALIIGTANASAVVLQAGDGNEGRL